jgi:hypothetical protein
MVRDCWRTVTDNEGLTGDTNALVVIIDVWGCVDGVHLPSSRFIVRQLTPETTDSITTRATYTFFEMATKVEAKATIQHLPTAAEHSARMMKAGSTLGLISRC